MQVSNGHLSSGSGVQWVGLGWRYTIKPLSVQVAFKTMAMGDVRQGDYRKRKEGSGLVFTQARFPLLLSISHCTWELVEMVCSSVDWECLGDRRYVLSLQLLCSMQWLTHGRFLLSVTWCHTIM